MKKDEKEPILSRRQFIKKAATVTGIAAGACLWGASFYSDRPVRRVSEKIYTFKDYRVEAAPLLPALAIVHGKDPHKMVRAAVDKLGGMSRFVKKGETVLIKPNVGWDRQPELGTNTSPAVVAAAVALCTEAGAAKVWVTDVSINDPYRSFARSGIEEAVVKAGAVVKYAGQNDFVLTDLKGEILTLWPVSTFYHQVDKVINIPAAKTHSLCKCTLAMKNWYGILGGKRNRLHQAIDTSIADLASAVRSTLTIMDATRVLMKNGPTGGSLSDVARVDTVIAGTDEVAIDACTLQFLNLKVEEVPFLSLAQKRGIGTTLWQDLLVAELTVG